MGELTRVPFQNDDLKEEKVRYGSGKNKDKEIRPKTKRA